MMPFLDYAPDDVMHPAAVPLVSILTYCEHPSMLYGTLLTFKTLRVGFPTAEVEVYDNGSAPEVVAAIRAAAEGVGARFTAMRGRHHIEHLRWLFLRRQAAADRAFVLADPELVFFDDVQRWNFAGCLMAGRLTPAMRYPGILSRARLHTSLIFVPCLQNLRRSLPDERSARWNAIGGAMVQGKRERIGWDSLAPMYAALRTRCHAFRAAELDAYSHLYLGTHLAAMGVDRGGCVLFDAHRAAATGNIEALRGIWRRQEVYFTSEAPLMTLPAASPLPHLREVQGWQGMAYGDDELEEAARRIRRRLAPRGGNSMDPTPPAERAVVRSGPCPSRRIL
jgi:hypothetical protein